MCVDCKIVFEIFSKKLLLKCFVPFGEPSVSHFQSIYEVWTTYNATFRAFLHTEQVFVGVKKHIQHTLVCYKTNKYHIFSSCSETNIKCLILKVTQFFFHFNLRREITTLFYPDLFISLV